MRLALGFLTILTACQTGEGADDLLLIDCAFVTEPIDWAEALPDGTTPSQRLDAVAVGAATGADGAAFVGTLSLTAEAASPEIDRSDAADLSVCAPRLRIPVRAALAEADVVLADVVGELITDPDLPAPATFDAAIADQPRFGLQAALEDGEAVNGVYLHLDTTESGTSGRVHALVSGEDAEVAWQRDVDLLPFTVAP